MQDVQTWLQRDSPPLLLLLPALGVLSRRTLILYLFRTLTWVVMPVPTVCPQLVCEIVFIRLSDILRQPGIFWLALHNRSVYINCTYIQYVLTSMLSLDIQVLPEK